LCLLCVFCASVANAFSLDREAFTFTSYDLNVRVEPDQQRLAVRGKITLRNDSQTPQKIAVLQISSSLSWRSINAGGKPLQFVAQPYTSDIDHTGELSEAIVTLPQAVAPKATIELEIGYEGVIVRGAGNVAWYPISTEAGNLSEGNSEFDAVGRWRSREAASFMHVQIAVPSDDENEKPELLVNATTCPTALEIKHQFVADCSYRSLGLTAPTFVMADYEIADRADITVHYLHGHDVAAAAYADAAEKVTPLITDWFGSPRNKAQTADLDQADAAPFGSGSLLLMPLANVDSKA